jgi:hypothetical protein
LGRRQRGKKARDRFRRDDDLPRDLAGIKLTIGD